MDTFKKEYKNMIQTNANSFAIEYVYYHPIEVVWEELKDICKWNSKQNYFSKFQFINGTKTWEIGSKYQFEYKETIPVTKQKNSTKMTSQKVLVMNVLKIN